MAQQSVRRDRKNQGFPLCHEHAVVPVRVVPYGPAASGAASEAGQMAASNYVQNTSIYRLRLLGRPQMKSGHVKFVPRSALRDPIEQVSTFPAHGVASRGFVAKMLLPINLRQCHEQPDHKDFQADADRTGQIVLEHASHARFLDPLRGNSVD